MRQFLFTVIFLLGAAALFGSSALACPSIDGIPDYNCDGDLQIAVLGDSLVYGFADTRNHGKGGYVLRAQKALKEAAVQNLGVPGLRTQGLLQELSNAFDHNKAPKMKAVLLHADVIFIDIGRNDYWILSTAKETYNNLVKAATKIRTYVKAHTKLEPLVVITVMALPDRSNQAPWVKAVNKLILTGNTSAHPSDLRFDGLSKTLLSSDHIHPTSTGYDALSRLFLSYIKGPLTKKMKLLRPDTDGDGIPDILETAIYHTNPNLADTDGDGFSDGEEVFTLHTDPLTPNP